MIDIRKDKMAKKFKVKKKFTLVDKILRVFLRALLKRPLFINLNENTELPKKCILIGNHRSAAGPFTYRTFMDELIMVVSAHQVCEGYRSRWNYLYHTFYLQKCNRPKPVAFVLATVLGAVIPVLYNFAGALPVYFDQRIINTFKYCIQTIEEGVPVAFFPENSDNGYFELIKEFNMGYLKLAKLYYERHNEDLPVYTYHFASNPSRIIIGKPMYYHELTKSHTDEEINEIFRTYMNSLNSVGKSEPSANKRETPVNESDTSADKIETMNFNYAFSLLTGTVNGSGNAGWT
jgi:hypothetical protein